MKKYYFHSIFGSFIYFIIVLVLIILIGFCCMADEIHSGVIFAITFLSISVITIVLWIGFSLSMRIQFDHTNKELYIKHPYFIKKIKYEDIVSIEISDYSECAFEFHVITRQHAKKIPYARYAKSKPNQKIKTELNELKKDLIRASNS